MAIVKIVNRNEKRKGEKITYKTLGSVKRLLNYILRLDKTEEHLKDGIYCNPNTAYEEFVLTKAMHGKLPPPNNDSEEVIHIVQSFKVEEVTPELAKKIADELLEFKLFEGFQVVYATHTDAKHIHTHFAINSVNYENGKRWHISKHELQTIKDKSNELCRKYNLSVLPKMDKNRLQIDPAGNRLHAQITNGEYIAIKEGRSWKAEILHAGMAVKKIAKSQDEFIEIMDSLGYKVRWEDTRKDITFTNADGKKINSDKLGFPARNYTPLTKEALEKQFAINRQVAENNNITVLKEQEHLRTSILKLAKTLSHESNPYPFQNTPKLQAIGNLEGQALKDKIKEAEKGKGLDWERE
ncbi:hypothetical protein acsn021_11010 [Anaerocolumna cellulosilytica]|uniref:MobA/VirD2-like nuclease domain-containing protein n=1 Tax=Anaerocolumna cellulosilytica TaxID=433286 RepID=A0A6S6R200_9FIRM|nr:relaxase/mobilization nuclease domain-containing protein [Anaerocolumna cellulosilytica]MBB5194588.1 hypothetical protein [Anaerocolumna cellulosilytica]BCJ93532.1 hypothetical protein acsn021_11010 [Anaerocolumna cellulosilytica]